LMPRAASLPKKSPAERGAARSGAGFPPPESYGAGDRDDAPIELQVCDRDAPEWPPRRAIIQFVIPGLTFDPREIDAYVAKLDPRRELVYRLAMRGLCDRCRSDRRFTARTDEIMQRFNNEVNAVMADANRLAFELTRRALTG
jgi:hypothetical protein